MAEESSGGFTLGWATKIGIVLAVIGVLLQRFAPGVAEQFAPLALQPFEAVLGIYLVLAFISNAFGEEKEFPDIIKQSLPLVFIYGIIAWVFGKNMGMVFVYIFVLFLVPLFGGAMRRMSTEGGFWRAWKAAKEGQEHPVLGVLAEKKPEEGEELDYWKVILVKKLPYAYGVAEGALSKFRRERTNESRDFLEESKSELLYILDNAGEVIQPKKKKEKAEDLIHAIELELARHPRTTTTTRAPARPRRTPARRTRGGGTPAPAP